jgi:hypothetical protein
MGLIAAPQAEAPKQLEAGDDEPAAAAHASPVEEADVEVASEEEANSIPEAELLSEFEKLEGRTEN